MNRKLSSSVAIEISHNFIGTRGIDLATIDARRAKNYTQLITLSMQINIIQSNGVVVF